MSLHNGREKPKAIWRDSKEPSLLDVVLVKDDTCPKCLGDLSECYICEDCCFDALDVIIHPEMFP